MINKYAALECVLFIRIQNIKTEFQKELVRYQQKITLCNHCAEGKLELLKQRNLCFLYRRNTEYLDSLLEQLQTMQSTIQQESALSKRSLDTLYHQLLQCIYRKKIIEKIKLFRHYNLKTKGLDPQ